ncbi:MAG: hypothetical protein EOP68_05735 [Sphingomonas sp.]|nr:MAG: hypothetical protein EOP68_05735 [Sphingomonas sp.]
MQDHVAERRRCDPAERLAENRVGGCEQGQEHRAADQRERHQSNQGARRGADASRPTRQHGEVACRRDDADQRQRSEPGEPGERIVEPASRQQRGTGDHRPAQRPAERARIIDEEKRQHGGDGEGSGWCSAPERRRRDRQHGAPGEREDAERPARLLSVEQPLRDDHEEKGSSRLHGETEAQRRENGHARLRVVEARSWRRAIERLRGSACCFG